MVKCLPEFEYFYSVLEKNKNIIFKIRRSKVTDYATLRVNKCGFSALTDRNFMKCMQTCAAQATFERLTNG